MFQLKTILFPVDFSGACQAASEQVAETAAHFGSKLLLLHVVQIPPAWYGDAVAYNSAIDLEGLREERRDALDRVLGDRDDVVIERFLGYGDAANAILECARAKHADLIMMPTHGCGPFRRFLIGSVTAKVLHDAAIPVWTDAHLPHPQTLDSRRSVICGVDFKHDPAPAIDWASQYAQSLGLELKVVHVVARTGDAIDRSGAPAAEIVTSTNVAAGLRETAIRNGAHAIVIGQGCLRDTMGRLRTNAYAIIREAPCPVIRC